MLFNPAWKRDTFTLQGLIAWLETKPPEQSYQYKSHYSCMLAQYFTAKGFESVDMSSATFDHRGGTEFVPVEIDSVAVHLPHTFGAALERAMVALSRART